MIIVVNTTTHNSFTVNAFIQLALQKTQHQFIFLLQDDETFEYLLPNNCSTYVLGKIPRRNLLWKYWYNYKIPSTLKKLNATLYINVNAIISLRTTVPQILWLDNLNLTENEYLFLTAIKKYYKNNTETNLAIAKKIVVVSDTAKQKLCAAYPSLQNTTTTLPVAANSIYLPCSWEQQGHIKNNYSNGKDYFLVTTSFTNQQDFINLLKAFTQFKKWQKSNLQLLIVTQKNKLTASLLLQLASYKYKADVHLLTNVPIADYAKILSAAYAFFYPYCTTNFPVQVLEAMQSHVPVITQKTPSIEAVFTENVGYAKSIDIDDYAAKMILLYKDEKYRNQLIQNGVAFNFNFSINSTITTLWQAINAAL